MFPEHCQLASNNNCGLLICHISRVRLRGKPHANDCFAFRRSLKLFKFFCERSIEDIIKPHRIPILYESVVECAEHTRHMMVEHNEILTGSDPVRKTSGVPRIWDIYREIF